MQIMNTKKFLILDVVISAIAGLLTYRFIVAKVDFGSLRETVSVAASIITLVGLVVYRIGLYSYHKKKTQN